MNIEQAIDYIRKGIDVSVFKKTILPSSEVSYNEGYKLQAIQMQEMTKKEIREEITNVRWVILLVI